MQYGHDVSYSFLMKASLFGASIWTIWSMVLLLALKPFCRFERRLFDSRNHVSLRLIIFFQGFASTAN